MAPSYLSSKEWDLKDYGTHVRLFLNFSGIYLTPEKRLSGLIMPNKTNDEGMQARRHTCSTFNNDDKCPAGSYNQTTKKS